MLKVTFGVLLVVANLYAQSSYIRVNQVGYEFTSSGVLRAYLMSTAERAGVTFSILDSNHHVVFSAAVPPTTGVWSHSNNVVYSIYPLDFRVPSPGTYTVTTSQPLQAVSPPFAVADSFHLYSGLLLNTKFFYETQRDGPNYIPNALRTAPGHLNDAHALVYQTPLLDSNDLITNTGEPLVPTGQTVDASGGWWDAGDYMKYVETISYTVVLQEIGIRDFPSQMGSSAPFTPPAPPLSISYSGAFAGSPSNADFSSEAAFGVDFLLRMWDDQSRTLYYQVDNSQDWDNFDYLSEYDVWILPQQSDHYQNCQGDAKFICNRPVFVAGPAGAKISPNLAGRMAAAFGACYQLHRLDNPSLANQCLKSGEDIFDLADTSLPDPAASVDSGTCASGCLLTAVPFDGYPETVWDDDMELGATELYLALKAAAQCGAASNLPHRDPAFYLQQAAGFESNYVTRIYKQGQTDTLNLYDVSALAHFELYRALSASDAPANPPLAASAVRAQLLKQTDDAVAAAQNDVWGFGDSWSSDTTSHGAGLSVMASQAFYLTGNPSYNLYAQRWLANITGVNAWGSSFIVGAGSTTFTNCLQHQVANIVGALNGTSGGTPVLWGASTEGPAYAATSGLVDGMLACPVNGTNTFAVFNGNSGALNSTGRAIYKDNVQSYSTTEPAIDLTAASFLMWSWRMAHQPSSLVSSN